MTNQSTRTGAAAVTALVALLATASACSRESQAQPAPAPAPTANVELVTVVDEPMPETLTLTGTLVANQESEVAADGAGKVLSTHVERGQVVERGAALARLDVRGATLAASDARAQLEAARARADADAVQCGRSERLLTQGAITRAAVERERAGCDASAWAVRAAEARAHLAAKAVGDGVVRAPFAGMIAERAVSPGEYVRPGSPIATLLELDPLRLELTVPESELRAIAVGQAVRFDVSALPGRELEGVVRYIGPALRRASRDLIVEAVVANADGALRPGMFAVAKVALGERPLPVIPRSALRTAGSTERVWAVAAGRLEERVVQVGPARGDRVAVLSGLRAGERVVRAPTEDVHEGLRVQ